ncbi:hypothetical protein THRCLA_20551 [Thraustotheca clavata]|uniref:Uncharacterized protein n=1 Tax=Thraustotheca clavata TaxID=74557 RepID=A0A1W0A693_9STRA|nr:hypothetical protein THRCLA_20551 [Thraustotheca clavata]
MDIWADVFQLDWEGDIMSLPKFRNIELPLSHLIKSIRMYKQSKDCLDLASRLSCRDDYDYNHKSEIIMISPFSPILTAPIKNMWLNELQHLLKYPVA